LGAYFRIVVKENQIMDTLFQSVKNHSPASLIGSLKKKIKSNRNLEKHPYDITKPNRFAFIAVWFLLLSVGVALWYWMIFSASTYLSLLN